ncbi:MAG: ABC transporter permease subunit, partial [Mesorhizobium sp.]
PVVCIVLLPALARFDWNQVQAARSLGANWARAIGGIIVPQLQISLLSAILMAFLTSLDESVISIFVSSGQNSTLPKLMFISLRDQIDPTIAAISTVWTAMVVVVVLIVTLHQKS